MNAPKPGAFIFYASNKASGPPGISGSLKLVTISSIAFHLFSPALMKMAALEDIVFLLSEDGFWQGKKIR
ncbi:MAG: hypothetical protein JNM21_03270 [Taibaiella sp.]|nr:hypothetical protein [Taibaiella sp.]